MKSHIIKGIISAVLTFTLFLIMSIVLTFFIERGIFVFYNLDMFSPNAFGIIVSSIALLIQIVFCKFKKFTEVLIYSIIYYFAVKALYVAFFGGLYTIAFVLYHYGVELPIVLSGEFWEATVYNLVYIPIGTVIGFICSIVMNIIRNKREKSIKDE